MNSFERVYNALKGEPVDRPPVFPQIGDHAGLLAGLTYDVMYKDAQLAAQAHLDALARYQYDVVTIQVEPSWPVAEACGSAVTYPESKCPWITSYLIQEKEDLVKLQVPDFTKTTSTRVMIEGTRILARQADVPVVAFMTGPLTFSLQLMPYEKLIKLMIKDPEFAQELVAKSTEVIRAYAQTLKEAGATIFMICEHDVQMMGPKHVGQFSIGYLPRLLDIYDYNMLHMCGPVMPHLRSNAAAYRALPNLHMMNVGPDVDLAEMREIFDGRTGIAGNIDHIELLPHGNPEQITGACLEAIEVARGHQDTRYMLAPGCEITADTPPENVVAFVRAATNL